MVAQRKPLIRRVMSWPWAQAILWPIGLLALLGGASDTYGTNWGALLVGAILIAAAIALAFLRLFRRRLEQTSGVESSPHHSERPQSTEATAADESRGPNWAAVDTPLPPSGDWAPRIP